jgi:hypothetical protein
MKPLSRKELATVLGNTPLKTGLLRRLMNLAGLSREDL